MGINIEYDSDKQETIKVCKCDKYKQALEIATDFISQAYDEGSVGEYSQDILKDIQELIGEQD